MTNTNDPFDEFEFKPLTEGLGFHKKNDSKNKSHSNQWASSNIEFQNSHLSFDTTIDHSKSKKENLNESKGIQNSSTQFNLKSNAQSQSQSHQQSIVQTPLNSPLPRDDHYAHSTVHNKAQIPKHSMLNIPTIEDDSISKAQSAVNEILKTLNQKKQNEENLQRKTKKMTWQNSTPSLMAGFLDTMLIGAFFLLCLIAMLAITKIDLVKNLSQPDPNFMIYWATLSLLAGIQIIYYTSCRAFIGFTPGEWAFEQRCGNELQQASPFYVVKVLVRSIFNIATGFITLSFISMIFNKDILSYVSGLQTQQQK